MASQGTAGTAGPLPFLDVIRRSFGRYDVSGVQAHTGVQATAANQALGARGYTVDNHVAFAGLPSLHTAAHEAAHVVQQRAGVDLKSGVGEAGDAYERHADAVADQVVQGKTVEARLDEFVGAPPVRGSQPALQKQDDPTKKKQNDNASASTPAIRALELDDNPARGAMERAKNLLKQGTAGGKQSANESRSSFFDALYDALERLDKRLTLDAPQSVGLYFTGSGKSSQGSTAARPTKDVVYLNEQSFDVTEVIEYMNLALLSVSKTEEIFITPKELRESFVKSLYEIREKFVQGSEAVEEARKKGEEEEAAEERRKRLLETIRDLKKELAKIDRGRSKTVEAKAPDAGGASSSSKSFFVPNPDAKSPERINWWQYYMKAKNGAGLFRFTELTGGKYQYPALGYRIDTDGPVLFTIEGVPERQIQARYPKGAQYVYDGDTKLMGLLPSH